MGEREENAIIKEHKCFPQDKSQKSDLIILIKT